VTVPQQYNHARDGSLFTDTVGDWLMTLDVIEAIRAAGCTPVDQKGEEIK